ncbi:hypothetical protein ACN9MB_01295 [Dyella kyungheensis]|uniref:hypothetical protein n=1 Tax=Dyella kyungheensis TaxID=1242174 RepID=UPI003CEDB220
MHLQEMIDFFTALIEARQSVLERVWGFRLRQLVETRVKASNVLDVPTRIAKAHVEEAENRYADIKRLILVQLATVQSPIEATVVDAAEIVLTTRMERIHDEIKARFQDELNGQLMGNYVIALSQFLDAKHKAALMWVALAIREEAEVSMQQRRIREATLDSAKASMRAAVAGEKAAAETAASAASASKSAFWTKVSAIGTVVAAVATAAAAIATAVASVHPSEPPIRKVINQEISNHRAVSTSEAE